MAVSSTPYYTVFVVRLADRGTGLSSWLVNAFNGEWLRTENAVPIANVGVSVKTR